MGCTLALPDEYDSTVHVRRRCGFVSMYFDHLLSLLDRIAILRRPTDDAAYCYRPSSVVCLSVGLSVTVESPAKTTEPIEMPFGLWTRVGPSKHIRRGAHWHHLANNIEPSICGGNAALSNYFDHFLFLQSKHIFFQNVLTETSSASKLNLTIKSCECLTSVETTGTIPFYNLIKNDVAGRELTMTTYSV